MHSKPPAASSRRIAARKTISDALKRRGLTATIQAVNALADALASSDPEYFGDTDTLLLGLLLAGSYTTDILEHAGANRMLLRDNTLESASGLQRWRPGDRYDPFERMLNETGAGADMIRRAEVAGRTLDSADILRSALAPRSGEVDPAIPGSGFPLEERRDRPAEAPLLHELELRTAEVLHFVAGFITPRGVDTPGMLRTRTRPIDEEEDWTLDKQLGFYFRGMSIEQLEFIISELNTWFVSRRLLTSPTDLCLRTIATCHNLLIAPELFVQAGGDLVKVEHGLDYAKRFVPARDEPMLALFIQRGRIYGGEFTYRDSLLVPDTGAHRSLDVQGVKLHSPQPLPLVCAATLYEFEDLLSREDVVENQIQAFLNLHPEFLMSLGYCYVQPQVCLYEPGSEKLIPDFILEVPGHRGIDILDLKLPKARLITRDPRPRLAGALMKAVAQLRKYANYFEKPDNRHRFEMQYGLTGFKPRVTVIIGRDVAFASLEERVEIEQQMGTVRLLTYDELIAYARSRLILLPPGCEETSWHA